VKLSEDETQKPEKNSLTLFWCNNWTRKESQRVKENNKIINGEIKE
jgi:hypothetical protein